MLPDLPNKRKKKEADFGIVFRKWLIKNPMPSAPFEHKDPRGGESFYLAELTEIQVLNALRCKHSERGSLIRVAKGTIGAADYVYYYKSPAWIVIKYPTFFCIIDIDAVVEEKTKSKYLSASRAIAIAHTVVPSGRRGKSV